MTHHQPAGARSTSANRTWRLASQPDLSGGPISQDTPELVARLDAKFDEDLFQVYWTVRALRNNRAPISGLDRPSRANRAIWDSCAVSSSSLGLGAASAAWNLCS
jgi:hypothetical protein